MRGMLLHQDGSKHAWLADQPALDPIITMDDATGEICSAFLVEEEGALSGFVGLVEVIERHGLFMGSTPTAAATTCTRPRPAARCRRPS